jgi:hypothetical protein
MATSTGLKASSSPLAGWDIAIAAFAIAFMTAGFWRLWPQALNMQDAPLGPIMLKAGVAALGFVGIASRWEDTLRAVVHNPLGLVLLALALISSVWAIVPTEALRHGILFLVIWGFGIALTLRFKSAELAEICGFAGVSALIMQVTAHKGAPLVEHFDGDLAFAFIGCAWAALRVPARRTLWIIATVITIALAFASGERATLGAFLGFAFGLGLAFSGGLIARRGAVSLVLAAWVIVAALVALTLFVMFGADPVSASVTRYFSELGSAMVIGQGFGSVGQSVADSVGAGLGLLGISVAALVVLATFFQILFGNPSGKTATQSQAGVFFACVGAICCAPNEVAMFGPVVVLFVATSFAISWACARRPQTRKSLFDGARVDGARAPRAIVRQQILAKRSPVKTKLARTPAPPLTNGLTPLGLRPRR